MSDTNYYDLLKNSDTSKYFSYMNEKYINLVGPKIKVFKLDKENTKIHDLYGTEEHSRIYLPPFEINAIYATNPWAGLMGTDDYEEKEENVKIIVNFDNMVKTIRDVKDKNITELYIEYAGEEKPEIEKIDNTINIYLNTILTKSISVLDFGTLKKLSTELNTITGITSTYLINEESAKIQDFNKTSFRNQRLVLFIKDMTYDKMTDVIEMGDILITEKWRVYEVKSANPTSDFGWNYATYTLEGNLIELDVLDGLPGNYRLEIEKRQYGMRKISI